MTNFASISPSEANNLIANHEAVVIDIRDEGSYQNGHIEGATQLDNSSIAGFIDNADQHLPLIIYCYHGISSQSAAAYFADHGFTSVYSVEGGYEAWKEAL